MLLSVFTVCSISSHAAENPEDAAVETVSSTAVDVDADVADADEEETVPAKDTAELQETGVDINPVNLGNSFYARIKMIHYNSYFVTATTNAGRTPITIRRPDIIIRYGISRARITFTGFAVCS